MKTKIVKQLKKYVPLVCACLVAAFILDYAVIRTIMFVNDPIGQEKLGNIATINAVRADETPLSVEQQIRQVATEKKFKWTEYLIRLAYCESRFDQYAIGDNGNSRGVFQINNRWHEVSNEQAFNIRFSVLWAIEKINAGKQSIWSCDKLIK